MSSKCLMNETRKRNSLPFACLLGGAFMLGAVTRAQTPSIAVEDCSKLKGKDKAACQARVEAAQSPAAKAPADNFPFPEEQSRGTAEQRKPATGDMPTSGVADPPAESMRPLKPDGTPDDTPSSSSSSSSSSSRPQTPADDDDAAPTTAGGDSSVKPSALKDLGSHGDTSAARTRLEQTRVEDDLKVGHFYFKDGNYAGALARYSDALNRDADNPDAHYGLAEVYIKQGKRDEAVSHLQQYLALAPDEDHSKDARRMLAKLGSR